MTESVQIILVALAALLLGILIPVLMSVRSTLKRIERSVETLEGRAVKVLDQSSGILTDVNEVTAAAKGGSGSIAHFSEALEDFADSLAKMQKSVRVATAVGASIAPAVMAAVKSFRGGGGEPAHPPMPVGAPVPGAPPGADIEELLYQQQVHEQKGQREDDERSKTSGNGG
jgi:uncharacterized protein YoxC